MSRVKKSKYFIFVVLVLSVIMVVGCSSDTPGDSQPERVTIVTSPPGQTWNTLANALAEYAKGDLTITVEPGTTYGNCINVHNGSADFCITTTTAAGNGYAGLRFYEQEGYGKLTNLRVVASLYKHHVRAITIDDNLNSLEDLKGKTLSFGPPGNESTDYIKLMLSYVGLQESDYVVKDLNYTEAAEAVKNRQLDAVIAGFPSPFAFHEDLAMSNNAHYIPLGEDVAKRLTEEWLGFDVEEYDLPTSVRFDKPYWSPYQTATIFVNKDVPDEVVYKFVKYLHENFDKLGSAVANMKQIKVEDLAKSTLEIPFHPGAVQYYKEVGLME